MKDADSKKRNLMRSGPDSYAKDAGFTLIELMVVVIIVGIVAAIAVPNLVSFTRNVGFEEEYSNVKSFMNKCRGTAVGMSNDSTMPTSLVLFANGYACIAWHDANGDGELGSGSSIDLGSDEDIDAGDMDGEVAVAYDGYRFDRTVSIDTAHTNAAHFDLATGQFQQIVYSNSGFVMNRLRVPTSLTARIVPGDGDGYGRPIQFYVLASGQVRGR